MLTGEPTIYVKTTDRGKKTAQAFCPRCGSQVYARHVEDAKFYAVRVGTVRQRNELEPKVQVWARSRVPWLNKLGSIRELDEQYRPKVEQVSSTRDGLEFLRRASFANHVIDKVRVRVCF